MKAVNEDERRVRRFLLGYSDEEERERIEERFVTDREYQEMVLISEEDLIEDYLDGKLSEEERRTFETHFLATPRQRRRLAVARSVRECAAVEAAAHSPPVNPRRRFVLPLAAALLICLGLGVAKFAGWSPWESQRAADERLLEQLNSTSGAQQPGHIFSAVIRPGNVRSPGATPASLSPPPESVVELLLVLVGDGRDNFRAVVSGVRGGEKFAVRGLRPRASEAGKVVPLKIPARLLPRGEYQLILNGVSADGKEEEVAAYVFEIGGSR